MVATPALKRRFLDWGERISARSPSKEDGNDESDEADSGLDPCHKKRD